MKKIIITIALLAVASSVSAEGNYESGVMYTGSPKVSLTADGLLASDSTFMNDLDEEERNISSSNYFKVYPVISIGIIYKF